MREPIRFFDELPGMCGIRGDTFPVFRVVVEADDLTGCTMVLVLEDMRVPGSIAGSYSCTAFEEEGVHGFTVQLGSGDTAALCGTYRMHFVLGDGADDHRNLLGTLTVLPAPQEVT